MMILKALEILITIAAIIGALTMVVAMFGYIVILFGMKCFEDEEDNSC